MALSTDQRGIVRAAAAALFLAALVLAALRLWLPGSIVGVKGDPDLAERVAFALRWDLALFAWLAVCIRAVSSGRFRSPADIKGSAYGPPSAGLAVKIAVLQNTLEQTVMAVGAHLALATALRGGELVIVPALVFLFLLGRALFVLGYRRGAPARAFGMALTAAPTVGAIIAAIGLVVAGR